MKHININDYSKFVDSTTSRESSNFLGFIGRASDIEVQDNMNLPRLKTTAIGMMAESGELAEVMKKIIFQGKEFNEEERFHMKRELGDVLWYWCQGCMALGYEPEEVIEENIRKLEKRYPNGFEVVRSEIRDEGDI